MEQLHFGYKLCLAGIALFGILAIVCTFAANRYKLAMDDLKAASSNESKTINNSPNAIPSIVNNYNLSGGDFVQGEKKADRIHSTISTTGKNSPVFTAPINAPINIGDNTTVNQVNEFKEPNQGLINKINSQLAALKLRHPTVIVRVDFESGNSLAQKVARIVSNFLTQNDLGGYTGNVCMGNFPNHPVTIIYNTQDKIFVQELLEILSQYMAINPGILETNDFPANNVRFYIYGTPSFDQDGKVSIQ